MNSMPAFSRARRISVSVRSWADSGPGCVSSRFMLGKEIPDASAKSRCSHRNAVLASYRSIRSQHRQSVCEPLNHQKREIQMTSAKTNTEWAADADSSREQSRTFRGTCALRPYHRGRTSNPEAGYVRCSSGPSKKVRTAMGRQICADGPSEKART
jgi:hypothetical protein